MSKFSVAMKRFGGFLKRNAFYFLIVLCIASVATVIALAVTRNTSSPDMSVNDNQTLQPEDPSGNTPGGNTPGGETPGGETPGGENPGGENPGEQQPPKQLTFNMPCNGSLTVEYAHDELVFSSTLDQWAVHMGIDLVSDDLNVYAAADGKISEVGYDELNGYYIAIEHEEGYVTIYKSLENTGDFKVGDSVEQGKLIGKMSDSQGEEMEDGAHLHFEMYKDGETINPLDKLVMNEK